MGHVELTLGAFVDAGTIAEQFADAKNGGKRIVEFVSHAGKHLAHGGKFFGLDELLLETLHFSDIAAGNDDTFNFAGFIDERAEMATEASDATFLVVNTNFDGAEKFATGDEIVEESQKAAAFFGDGAIAKDQANGFCGFETQNFFYLGTDEGVALVGIDDEDEVGETVDEATGKFLLLVEAFFNGAALGNVDQRTLVADDTTSGIADSGSGVEANERLTVFAVQSDLDAFGSGLAIDFAGDNVALVLVDEDLADALAQEFFTGVIAQHANESRIDLENFIVGSDDVDAFLQGFEELGKTSFVATHGGYIASKNGKAVDFTITDHGVGSAIEEVNGVESLDAYLDGTIPLAALNEAIQFAGD